MKTFILLILVPFYLSSQFGQTNENEKVIYSNVLFSTPREEAQELELVLEAQKVAVETFYFIIQNINTTLDLKETHTVTLLVYDTEKKRKISIPIPIENKYVKAFKSRKGIEEKANEFIVFLYNWILESL